MSKSEKMLAGLLGVAVTIYGLTQMLWPAIAGPVVKAQNDLDSATTTLNKENEKVELALARIRTMELHKDHSLSSNVSEASLGYEQWLSDLAENVAKFRDPKVTRETTSPSRDNSYVAIKIRVAGQGTMKQLREFLYRFHRASVLHQISSLTADAIDNSSNPLLDIVILADGLSLRDAAIKGPTLFPRSEVVSVGDDPDRRVTVADGTAAWPTETPFEIRIDDEYLTVLERVHQIWEIKGTGEKTAEGAVVTLLKDEPEAEPEAPAQEADANTSDSMRIEILHAETDSKKNAPPAPKPVTTKLAAAWDGESQSILVALPEGFDRGRIKVRIGKAELEVVARREVWRINDQKFRAKAGTIVEGSPVHPDFSEVTLADFDALLDLNPFAKTRSLPPNFLLTGDRRIERGDSAVLTPLVQNLGPNATPPEFEILSELPDGMNYAEGKLHWTPPEDMEPGDFDIKIRASSDMLESPLEETFEVTLTVTKKNDAPLLWPPEGDLVGVIGQPVKFSVSATDTETPAEELRFSFGDGSPEGATIDEKTGAVAWAAPKDAQPGPVEFPIKVVDTGDPPETTAQTFTVNVEDDRALFTYLTGSIAADSRRQAWFSDKSTNKLVIVEEGDNFKFAGFDALILTIGRDFILMQQDTDTMRVDIGNNLRQAVVIASTASEKKEPPYDEPGTPATGEGTTSTTDPDAANAAELDALLRDLEAAEGAATEKPDSENEKPAPPEPENKLPIPVPPTPVPPAAEDAPEKETN